MCLVTHTFRTIYKYIFVFELDGDDKQTHYVVASHARLGGCQGFRRVAVLDSVQYVVALERDGIAEPSPRTSTGRWSIYISVLI